MVSSERILRINTQLVASQIIDDEAVLINLGNGMVYTLDDTGAAMWRMIELGRSLEFMSKTFAAHYSSPADVVLADLAEVAQELHDEELIVFEDGVPGADGSLEDLNFPEEYSKPKMIRYDDMRDVLALDPPLPQLEPGGQGLKTGE
jgi:hypothetical protein